MVMVLMSVLVAVSIRWLSAGAYTISTQADLLAANIRHIQTLAATQGIRIRLNINATGYCATLPPATACTSAIADPATGLPLSVTLTDAVTLAGTSTDVDSLGRPIDAAGALLTANRIFQFTATNSPGWSVTLAPLTGFVTVTTP